MKALFMILFFAPSLASAALFKCVVDGKVIYQDFSCASGSVLIAQPKNSAPALFGRPSVTGSGSVSLTRGSGGTYNIPASVNGSISTVLVDTGAGITSISGNLYRRIGSPACQGAVNMSTANGVTKSCLVLLSRVSLAGFEFTGVIAAVNQNMGMDALIGNDILSLITVNQSNGVLSLSR